MPKHGVLQQFIAMCALDGLLQFNALLKHGIPVAYPVAEREEKQSAEDQADDGAGRQFRRDLQTVRLGVDGLEALL